MALRRRFLPGTLSFVLLILATFSLGTLVGARTIRDYPLTRMGQLLTSVLGAPATTPDYALYWDVYRRLETQYPKPIDKQELLYGAIRGTVAALGDRFSLFLSPSEANRFFEDIKGEFSGIGAEISQEQDLFVIVAPLPGSPAEAAGLKANDAIVSVDGKESQGMQFNELINAIRGPKGSTVKLGILREGFDEPKEFALTRDTITVASTTYTLRPDGLAYVKISQFSDDTTAELDKAADDILAKHATGIIVDLRNDPGGYLETAIDVSSFFLDHGTVVSEERKGGDTESFAVSHEPRLKDIPLVVLVNGGSASASEIFAGAMQDTGRAKLVGVKTFGKGSVQEVQRLADGSALRLTIAKWLTPNGREINGTGIEPDFEVRADATADSDPQLDKAVELLLKQ